MNLFSRVLSWFGRGGLSNQEDGAQYDGPQNRSTEAGITVSDERAMQVSAVWSCVRLIAETVAMLPLGLFQQSEDGREPLDPNHPLVLLLNRRPNMSMTAHEFREALTLQLALWGNGYARKEYLGERLVSLTPLRPEAMTVVRLNGELQYHYSTPSGVQVLSKQSILHLKGFSVDGVVGLSPLAYARHVMGVTVAADTYAAKSFANGGRPASVLKFDDFLTDEQRELAHKMYENLVAGADNAGKPLVLEGGTEYKPIAIPPDDMQMLQSRTFQLGEIARFFRVPAHLINDSEKATAWGTGIEQLNLGFLQYTLTPYLRRWETVLRDGCLTPTERERITIEHNVEGLLRADSKSRADFYGAMAQNGIMTRNEIRKKENLPMMEGGDELTIQVNLAPAGSSGSEQDAA